MKATCLAVMLATAGCGAGVSQLAREIPRQATPGAVEGGLDAFDDPALRQRLQRIVASPEVRAVERDLFAGIVDGVVATLSDPARAKRIQDATSGMVASAVDGATGRAPALQSTVGWLVATTVRGAARGIQEAQVGKGMASAVTEDLGPAVEATLRDDLAPGAAAVLRNEDLRLALGETARTLGREMVVGITEGLAAQRPPAQADSLLSRATGLAEKGATLFGSAAWVLLLVIAALGVWIAKLLAEARRFRGQAAEREASAHLLEERAEERADQRADPRAGDRSRRDPHDRHDRQAHA